MQSWQRPATHLEVAGPNGDGPIPLPRSRSSQQCPADTGSRIIRFFHTVGRGRRRRCCSALLGNAAALQPPRAARWGLYPALAQADVLKPPSSPAAAASCFARASCRPPRAAAAAARPSHGTEGAVACADAGAILRPLQLTTVDLNGGSWQGCGGLSEPEASVSHKPRSGEEQQRKDEDEAEGEEGPYGGQHSAHRRLGRRRVGGVGNGDGGAEEPSPHRRTVSPAAVAAQQQQQPQQPPLQQDARAGSLEGQGSARQAWQRTGEQPRRQPHWQRQHRGRQSYGQEAVGPNPTAVAQPLHDAMPSRSQHRPEQQSQLQPQQGGLWQPQQQQHSFRHNQQQHHHHRHERINQPQAHRQQQQQHESRRQLHLALVHARHCLSRALASAPSSAALESLLADCLVPSAPAPASVPPSSNSLAASASTSAAPATTPLPLLDPVCVSAAVCRMVRLRRQEAFTAAAAIDLAAAAARDGGSSGRSGAAGSVPQQAQSRAQGQQRHHGQRAGNGPGGGSPSAGGGDSSSSGFGGNRPALASQPTTGTAVAAASASGASAPRWSVEGAQSTAHLEAEEAGAWGVPPGLEPVRSGPPADGVTGRRRWHAESPRDAGTAGAAAAGALDWDGGGGAVGVVALAAGRAVALVPARAAAADASDVGVASGGGGLTLAVAPLPPAAMLPAALENGTGCCSSNREWRDHEGPEAPCRATAAAAAADAAVARAAGRRGREASTAPTHGPKSRTASRLQPELARHDQRFLRLVRAAVRQCLADAGVAFAATAAEAGPHSAAATAGSSNRRRRAPSLDGGASSDWAAAAAAAAARVEAQGRGGGAAATVAFLEAAAAAQAAAATASSSPLVAAMTAVAPVGRFRPREVANVVWGLACLRSPDSQLCGSRGEQQLLLRLAGELLPPPPPPLQSNPVGGGAGQRRGSTDIAGARSRSSGSADGSGVGSSSWFSNSWRPGELAMLGWGMARAGVAPPSRRWLLSYIAAWDDRTMEAAGASDLACLAWALARWQRMAARAAAWRRAVTGGAVAGGGSRQDRRTRPGGAATTVSHRWRGLRKGGIKLLRRRPAAAATAAAPLPSPRALLPPAWLEAFWAASGEHLHRGTSAAAAAAATGPRRGDHPFTRRGAEARRQQPQPPAAVSVAVAVGGGVGGPGGSGSAWGAAEVAMLLWSVGRLQVEPPHEWTSAALRAAAAAAPAAPPLALATTLRGAALIAACAPVRAPEADSAAPLAAASDAGETAAAAAAAAAAETAAAAAPHNPAPHLARPQRHAQHQRQPETNGGAALRLRPRRPPPVPCQSLLAAFARSYLGRCTAALGGFGPSQVVDLLAAIEALSASGHLPPPAALPPAALASLLDSASARLQRCYSAGLGPRHLLAAASSLAAVRHVPPADWLTWWLEEMYGSFVGGRLRTHELAVVLRALAAFRVVPGPAWRSALLAAAACQLRRTDRAGLAALAEAMAAAGLRPAATAAAAGGRPVGQPDDGGSGNGDGGGARAQAEDAEAEAVGWWPWLSRFLRVWAGRRAPQRVRYYGGASPLLRRPTARQADRLCATLTALAGPPETWPPAPRAALRAALRRVAVPKTQAQPQAQPQAPLTQRQHRRANGLAAAGSGVAATAAAARRRDAGSSAAAALPSAPAPQRQR